MVGTSPENSASGDRGPAGSASRWSWPSVGLAHAAEEKILNIYNWSDYIGDDTIANFEKETGIKVHYDTFDSNEALHAKLVAGKTGYDIVVPSANWAKIQLEGGLLMKLDKSKITTYGNLDPYVMRQLA